MIIASKQTIRKACRGTKLGNGGKCNHKGPMMKKKMKKKMNEMENRVSKVEKKVQSVAKGGKPSIYIKPSKRGSFTAWCKKQGYGGVTTECISKGKNSNSTAIRKKATFAANARKWN